MDSGLTEIDLAGFTGNDPARYGQFVYEALEQAGDLFELATGLLSLPTSGLDQRLARRGILAMAEAIYEGNNYRELRHSPFRSETIGSYNYQLFDASIRSGIPTGIAWFDMAVERLKVTFSAISGSAIAAFDRPGDLQLVDGRWILVGPADTENFKQGSYRLPGIGGGQPQ